MQSDLAYFVQNQLKPALFEHLSTIFPEMGFRWWRGMWASPRKIGGEEPHLPRPDKCVVTRKQPDRMLEQGGESVELIEYYRQQHGLSKPIEAIKALAEALGLELPQMEMGANYEGYRAKQEALCSLMDKMRAALFTEAGAATLAYCESRGWSREDIEQMGVGYCSPETAEELRKALGKNATMLQSSVGYAHTLAIPYISRGEILGVVFRNTTGEGTKYTEAFVSQKATKLYNLYGLTGLSLKGSDKEREIVVVEGEIDALRATAAGVQNVVAAAGKNLPLEALKNAQEMGAQRVVLLLDYDGEEKEKERAKDIAAALRNIRAAGLPGLVAAFPHDGEKVDTDTYLQAHTGEELQALIDGALLGVQYQLNQIITPYSEKESLTGKEEDSFRREITSLAFESSLSTYEQRWLFAALPTYSAGRFTESELYAELQQIEEAKKAAEQRASAAALLTEAQGLIDGGNTAAALNMMEKRTRELRKITKEAAFSKYLQAPTEESIRAGLKTKKAGIPTGYYFTKKDGERERLEIPTGALTFICAPTSHGKSRFLQNLALQMAQEESGGSVLYISLEEDREAVIERFINLSANIPLNRSRRGNNSRLIRKYFGEGDSTFIAGEQLPKLQEAAKALFSLLTQQRLCIFSRQDSREIGYIEELQGAVEYLSKQMAIKAVFIDYVQEIYSHERSASRKDELMKICNSLMELSVATGLPIVLASQLNREAVSPLDMSVQNISDASNIEHAANTILLFWDSVVLPQGGKDNSYYFYETKQGEGGKTKQRKCTEEAQALEDKGFTMGTAGTIYAVLAKNRSGERNIEAILSYNGNTGVIESNAPASEDNEPHPREEQPQQQSIFEDMGIE